jgi:hypothetical protein
MYKITQHRRDDEFSAPEGYHYKDSHSVGPVIWVLWEGRPTPPSLVKLCNLLVRSSYATVVGVVPSIRDIVTSVERELNAQGLREPA